MIWQKRKVTTPRGPLAGSSAPLVSMLVSSLLFALVPCTLALVVSAEKASAGGHPRFHAAPVGSVGWLAKGDYGSIPVAPSEPQLREIDRADQARWHCRLIYLMEDRSTLLVLAGTKVHVVAQGGELLGADALYVRIDDGTHSGQSGWVSSAWVTR